MKSKIVSLLLVITLFLSMVSALSFTSFASAPVQDMIAPEGSLWDGTVDNTWFNASTYADTTEYHLSTPAQLASLKAICATYNFSGKTVYLDNDLYLNNVTGIVSDTIFVLEGNHSWNNYMIDKFAGTFDGQNHAIYGLSLNLPVGNNVGLFQTGGANILLKNLKVLYASIENGRMYAGGIIGNLGQTGSIENCHFIGNVSCGWGYVGGIAGVTGNNGTNWNGHITECTVRGSVSSTGLRPSWALSPAGGIIGYCAQTTKTNTYFLVADCYTYATVIGTSTLPAYGGIIGMTVASNNAEIIIENCGVSGQIEGDTYFGGFVGRMELANKSTNPAKLIISNSYVSGSLVKNQDTAKCGILVGSLLNEGGKGVILTDNVIVVTDSEPDAVIGEYVVELTPEIQTMSVALASDRGESGLMQTLNGWLAEKGSTRTQWMMGHHGLPALEGTYEDDGYVTEFNSISDIETIGVLVGSDLRISEKEVTRLLFTEGIQKSYVETLKAENEGAKISFGILICEADSFSIFTLTPAASAVIGAASIAFEKTEVALEKATLTEDGKAYVVKAKSDLIDYNNMMTEYAALGYIKVVVGEEVTYIDAPYDPTYNVRSAYQVAKAALADVEANYSEQIKENLKSYLDTVVSLSITEGGVAIVTEESETYTQPYTLGIETTNESVVLQSSNLTKNSKIAVYINGVRYREGGAAPSVNISYQEGKVVLIPQLLKNDGTVTTIQLGPKSVTLWKNFPTTLTLASTVNSSNYTKKDLSFSSSNKAVLTVDNEGNITPVSVGKAYVVATTPDGTVSNSILITVTEEVTRAADQMLTIGSNEKLGIKLNQFDAPQNYGEASIAVWKNNAKGAFTITIDDSITSEFSAWNAGTQKYGIPVTFIVPGMKAGTDAPKWREAIAAGNDVQSHTELHRSIEEYEQCSTAEIWMDYYLSVLSIGEATCKPVTICGYSYGWSNKTLAELLFLGSRGPVGTPNKIGNIDYQNLNSMSITVSTNFDTINDGLKTLYDQSALVWNQSWYGGWTDYHFHSIAQLKLSGGVVSTPDVWVDTWFASLKPMVDANQVWIDTYEKVSKYGQERDTATLTVVSSSENEITLSLHDKMDDTLYDEPLTLQVKVDSTWQAVSATQNGVEVSSKLVTIGDNTYVYVDAIPDAGNIVLQAQ